jgi:hypothetical protein
MGEFREAHIVLAQGKEYSRANLLSELGLAENSPHADERLAAVEKALDRELTKIVNGECVFRLRSSKNTGEVVVAAIEESHFDQHAPTIQTRVSKETVAKALGSAIASLKS